MLVLLRWIFLVFMLTGGSAQAQTALIAVAANMKDAFTEINAAFQETGKTDLKIIYGSSGNFYTQIMHGAPFDLLISADESFPLELYKNGKTPNEGRVYAIGKMVMLVNKSSGIKLGTNRTELLNALAKANKVVIAKPDLAPYGRAAVAYLKAEGLWESTKNKLVYADNIGMATMFVASGAAAIGLTALSLARSPELAKETNYLELNEKLYPPIYQRMVLIKGATQGAVDLYAFLQTTQAKNILLKYGYTYPQ